MAMASSLLKVRKIWILAVHVTLILFRYMTEAKETERVMSGEEVMEEVYEEIAD